jgi:hypothetical protein
MQKNKMLTKTQRILNNKLSIYNNYFNFVPLDEIFNILRQNNITVIQEDCTSWQGILCGEQGKLCLETAYTDSYKDKAYTPIINVRLILTWYKMQSGRYEIVCYIS